jgi:GNAT superfamily N-acetyltransferase
MVEISNAGPDQARVVGQLLWDFNTEFGVDGPSAEAFAARFAELLARDDVLVVLSGSSSGATGFAYLTLRPTPYYDGPLAQLEELYVQPRRRGQGIGTALLRAVLTEVRARGGAEVQINVDEVDVDARRFYERHGFSNHESGSTDRMLCYIQEF